MADGLGNWTTAAGQPVTELAGCLDVDIAVTPFTNTLPIRRLRLGAGASAVINVVYVAVPALQVRVAPQRYTCLATSSAGGTYQFESLDSSFSAVLTVDAAGLVEEYPQLFKRIWYRIDQ